MPNDFDVVVIGSGFGGAICSARLAEAGYRVLILERGRRWDVKDFPRKPDDAWTWDHDHPEKKHGMVRLSRLSQHDRGARRRRRRRIARLREHLGSRQRGQLSNGWPSPITFGELQPHYERVGKTMNVKAVPEQQWPARTKLLKEAAEKLGYGDRFRRLELAVTFDDTWTYDQANPHEPAKSKPVVNAQGQTQGTCVHLGDCDIGCEVRARNTLDLNYIPIAEQHGAVVKPLHIVRTIKPTSDGYEVSFHEIASGALVPGTATGRLVIVAAGSLGSTELLLKCRADASALPNISATLGHRWSSNGDFLTPAIHFTRNVNPTRGPTITGAVDLLDGAFRGQPIFIEDGGLPNIADGELRRLAGRDGADDNERALIATVRLLFSNGVLANVMPWFAQSRDAGRRRPVAEKGQLFLKWDARASKPTDRRRRRHAPADGAAHRGASADAAHLDGVQRPDHAAPAGRLQHERASADTACVDHKGEVFGYRNLLRRRWCDRAEGVSASTRRARSARWPSGLHR